MPKTIGIYKCLTCEENFEATSEEYRACGCGKSAIKLYDTGHGYTYQEARSDIDCIEKNTYYSQDDFFPMTEKMNSLIDEIKEIHSRVQYFFFVSFNYKYGMDGTAYLNYLTVNHDRPVYDYSSEMNFLDAWIEFSVDNRNSVEIVENRLAKLVKLMKMLSSGDIDFSNRKRLIELSEQLELGYSKEQIKEYNYTFYV